MDFQDQRRSRPSAGRPLARRTFLRRSALLALGLTGGAGLVSACQGQPASNGQAKAPAQATAAPTKPAAAPAPPTAAAAKPAESKPTAAVKRGGVLRDVQRFAIDSLDPHLASTRNIPAIPLLYDSLLSYRPLDPNGEKWQLGPGLAESHEVVDASTFVFKLRQGVKFHDGSDFNAEVAKWNLERAATNAKSKVKETVRDIKEIQIVDPNTIRVLTKVPSAAFPIQMTSANLVMVPMVSRVAVEKLGEEAFGNSPAGTGPMRLKEWVKDDRIVLEKFAGHWERGEDGQPLPYLDGFSSRLITDLSVAFVELRSGNMDSFYDVDLKDVATARGLPDLSVMNVPGAWTGFPALYFNPRPNTTYPFSNNQKLRQAAQYATDRESMAKALGFGMAQPHFSLYWFPGMLGYDESLPKYEFNLDKAKQLMAEAGFSDGVDLECKVINRSLEVRSVEVLQAMWEKAGIRLKVQPLDRLPWIDDGRAGNYQALSHTASAKVDPQLTQDARTGSTYNWPGYSNPEVDKLYAQAGAETNDSKRAELYKQIQRILHEQAYHLAGFRFPAVAMLNRKVKHATTMWNFRYIWMDS